MDEMRSMVDARSLELVAIVDEEREVSSRMAISVIGGVGSVSGGASWRGGVVRLCRRINVDLWDLWERWEREEPREDVDFVATDFVAG